MYLCVLQGTPNSGTAMFYFKTNVLMFDKEFLGRVHLVAAISDLLGELETWNINTKPTTLLLPVVGMGVVEWQND